MAVLPIESSYYGSVTLQTLQNLSLESLCGQHLSQCLRFWCIENQNSGIHPHGVEQRSSWRFGKVRRRRTWAYLPRPRCLKFSRTSTLQTRFLPLTCLNLAISSLFGLYRKSSLLPPFSQHLRPNFLSQESSSAPCCSACHWSPLPLSL